MIEFSFVAVIFVGMLSLSFNAIMGFCVQQYVAYAVFMTARSYQGANSSLDANTSAARAAISGYFPGVSGSGTGMSVPLTLGSLRVANIISVFLPQAKKNDYGPADENSKVRVVFEVPLVMVPFGPNMKKTFGKITLDAQSYLGREVSATECRGWFEAFMDAFAISGAGMSGKYQSYARKYSGNMDDNGC